jgi:hypothetical protein
VKRLERVAAQSGRRHAQQRITVPQRRVQNSVLSRAALDFLLGETVAFLLAAGLSRKSLATELRREASRIGAGARLRRPRAARVIKEGHENLVEIAGVIHDWHRQRTYTDSRSGEPRALRAPELQKLVGTRFPHKRTAAAIQWMLANEIIRRRDDGRFVIAMGRHVLLRNQRTLAMERAAALVPQYLRISLRNADTRDSNLRDIDRDARVFFLPEKWVALWRNVARERTQAFLEGLDNWLEDHTRPEDAGPVREVAVHCYGYTGEPRSPRAGNTNIARLEGEG